MKECRRCGFNDEDYGCTCPHYDKWYACPIEAKKPENVKALKEYAEWASRRESEEYIEQRIENYDEMLKSGILDCVTEPQESEVQDADSD